MKRRAKLGDIEFTVVKGENPNDSVTITDHSVESGQDVSDHVKQEASIMNLQGEMIGDDATDKLQALRKHMNDGDLLTYIGRNIYSSMAIESINRNHSKENRYGFGFNITLKQVRIATSKEVEVKLSVSKRVATKAKKKTNNGKQQISSSSSNTSNTGGTTKRAAFIDSAKSMLGFTYSQPNRMGRKSADCSSLVGRAMVAAGITRDAQLTTRSIHNDSRFTKISKAQMQEGDILWQNGHMGIYLGNNKLIEASSSKGVVKYATLGNRFSYAYRINGI